MEKVLSLEGRSIKALALGWESCRISKVSDLKSSSSVGTALPALEEEEVATSRARGIRIVKTETEIERRKLISQKSSKVNKLFEKSKRNH